MSLLLVYFLVDRVCGRGGSGSADTVGMDLMSQGRYVLRYKMKEEVRCLLQKSGEPNVMCSRRLIWYRFSPRRSPYMKRRRKRVMTKKSVYFQCEGCKISVPKVYFRASISDNSTLRCIIRT